MQTNQHSLQEIIEKNTYSRQSNEIRTFKGFTLILYMLCLYLDIPVGEYDRNRSSQAAARAPSFLRIINHSVSETDACHARQADFPVLTRLQGHSVIPVNPV